MDNVGGSLAFSSDLDNAPFLRKLAEMEAKIKGTTGTLESEGGKWDGIVKSIAIGMAGAFTFSSALQFREKLIQVRGEFQKYEAILTNSLGSQAQAAESMKLLANIAGSTPFQLNTLTASYVKLVNQGFKPTREEIIKLGDLASSTGKGFDQLAEAVLDAQTGQFERLKEFGIKASASGDQIAFSFKGITTTVQNSGDAIRDYMLSLGDLDGVKGSMAAVSKTLEGQVSNLEDSISAMFNKMGADSESFLSNSISATKFLVENYEAIGKALGAIIATYGTYKAAVIAITVVERTRSALMVGDIATKKLVITWEGIHALALGKLKAAQAALNTTMLANPYVAVATLLMGVAAAAWALSDGLSAAERAQDEYNEKKEQAIEIERQHKAEVDSLISTLTDQAVADLDRVSALEKLKQKYPEIFAQYDIENIKLADILKLKQQIAEQDAQNSKIGNQVQYLTQLKKIADIQKNINSIQSDVTLPASARDASIRGLQESLKKERELLKLYDKDVQTDRVNSWTSTLSKLTDIQLKAELDARKTALSKMQAQDATTHKITGGGAFGTFDEAELKAQTASLERELAKRNEATFTASSLQAKYQKELTQLEQERLKILSQKLTEGDLTKQLAEIDSKISAVEKKKKALEGKTPAKQNKETEAVEFDYTDVLARSFSEATAIMEKETAKWQQAIDDALQAELDSMSKVAEAEAEAAQKKADLLADALSQSMTLSEKFFKIEEDFAAKKKALVEANPEDLTTKLELLEQQKQAEMNAALQSTTYIIEMGRKELKAYIEKIKAEIQANAALGLSTEDLSTRLKILQELLDVKTTSSLEKIGQGFQAASAIFGTISDMAKDTNKEFSQMAGSASEVAGSIGDIATGISSGNYLQAAQGILQLGDALDKAFGRQAKIARLDKERLEYNNALLRVVDGISNALERQLKVLESAPESLQLTGSMQAYEKSIYEADKALNQMKFDLATAPKDVKIELNLEKLKEVTKLTDSKAALTESLRNGIITQEDFDIAIQYLEVIESGQDEIERKQNEYNQFITGTTAESITDSITEGFANGQSGIAGFADTFEELMRNAMLEALKVQALEAPMQAWYKMFAESMSGGLSPEERKALEESWNNMIQNYELQAKEMEQMTGVSLQNPSGNSGSSLTGAIKGVTEETASLIGGQMNAIRMNQAQSLEMVRSQLFHLANISNNTYKLHSIEEKLASIDAKTIKSSSPSEMF